MPLPDAQQFLESTVVNVLIAVLILFNVALIFTEFMLPDGDLKNRILVINHNNFPPFSGSLLIVGIPPLYAKVFYHPMEHGVVEIPFACQVNKIGLVVRDIIIEFNGKATHARGDTNLVFLKILLVVKEKIDGIFLV